MYIAPTFRAMAALAVAMPAVGLELGGVGGLVGVVNLCLSLQSANLPGGGGYFFY